MPPTQAFGFSDPDFDWDLYVRARPIYPASLWKTILEYHTSHNGQLDTALEVGAGYGVGTKDFLAQHFHHTYTTDPVAHNLEAAKHFLRPLIEAGKVTTVQSSAEEECRPKASVDLIMGLQCLHWADAAKFVPAMASMLKPGGTVAATFYSNISIVNNARAHAAWVRAFSKAVTLWVQKPGSEGLANHGWDGMNTILPLPSEYFAPGAKRIRLNADVLEEVAHRRRTTPFKLFPGHGEGGSAGTNHLKDEDVRETGSSDEWTRDVDKSFMRESIQSYQVDPAAVEDELREVERALDEESGGRATVRWVVDIVLATRR